MSGTKIGSGILGAIASAVAVIILLASPQAAVAAARVKTATTSPVKISGTAPTSVVAGTNYSFTPNSNGGGAAKSFSISNKPAWASFSISSGKLSGLPTLAQVGSYANVTITVTDGVTTATLSPFGIAVTAPATATSTTTTVTGSAALSWAPPTQNTDGSALVDLAGYAIYYGTSASNLATRIAITDPSATSYTVGKLSTGTYYFALAAYTSTGIESALSSIGSKTIN